MKKTLALVLTLVMLVSIFAGCKDDKTDDTLKSYTYNSYMNALGTNWNPHTWEMSADSTMMGFLEAPLADMTVLNSEEGSYQWIFVAASDIQDVTKDHQDDLTKYGVTLPSGKTASNVTENFVYEIKLRPEMKWQDGTLINADTYIYSMQQMLDPVMKNYRSNTYWSGDSALAGAKDYYYSTDKEYYDSVLSTYGKPSEGAVDKALAAGETVVIDAWNFYGMQGAVDAEGNACPQWLSITDDHKYIDPGVPEGEEGHEVSGADIYAAVLGYISQGYFDSTSNYANCLCVYVVNNNYGATWDVVGLYKVDEYTIRYVCQSAYAYNYFLTSCTGNWLVYKDLYEKCKQWNDDGSFKGSTYGTSLETTMSYGIWKMTSLEDDKQVVFEQNENYFEFTKNEDGSLSSTTETIGFKVDGEYKQQLQTTKYVINVMDDNAAKLAFMKGDLDDWNPSAEDTNRYSTSEQMYKADETYTMRLFFHTNLDSLKTLDSEGKNKNSVVLSNDNFRKAMSLAINRSEFVAATPAYKPAYSVLNSLYHYNIYEDPTSTYRSTDEAMQAIVNLYGVEYGEGEIYPTLKEAYDSINGYNLTEAKNLMKTACEELVAAGLYTAGEDIKIQIAWQAAAMDSDAQNQVAIFEKQINDALEGSGFGKITLEGIGSLSKRYADVMNGTYAIGWGAWGGAAFYPFKNMQNYCDPDNNDVHESGCWDPTTEMLTINVDGEDVTMTWQKWSQALSDATSYGSASFEVRLHILATMEEKLLEMYYFIPVCTTTSVVMLSYKQSMYTENYNIMYGYGGNRLMHFNYTDAEWAEYVASQNGSISY